jgi:putative RNase toxin 44 of polymorphic toxin system
MTYVKAREGGTKKTVVYTDAQDVEWIHAGGSPAWRNNNPGNIVAGSFCTNHGGIGFAGRFACFPDHATGRKAVIALLRTGSYKSLSIKDGITKYAPPFENDTESYQKNLSKMTGLDLDLILDDLDDTQMGKVADAIQVIEGSIPGTITQSGVKSVERGSPAAFELRSMSEEQRYEHLKQAWKRAQERFGLTGNTTHDFQEANGRVHLIGARGLLADTLAPCENRSTVWDDTMFVVYKDDDGVRRVETFYLSTEPNDNRDAEAMTHVSTLKFGMHRFYLAHHNISSAYKQLDDYLANFPGKKYKYRALKPHASGVPTFLDTNHDRLQSAGEAEESDNEINIHYGGANAPEGWSHGCQVLKGPKAFRDFIQAVESDTSIMGSIDNELVSKPRVDGTRYVVYLLVEGTFLAPPGVTFPLKDHDAAAHYALNEGAEGGYFPIGANNFWHGGAHLDTPKQAIHAIADGDVLAYRITRQPLEVTLGGDKLPLSSSFVLIRHERLTPKGAKMELFSLYMHLLPLEAYDEEQKKAPPALFKKHTFKVKTTEDGRGLNVRSAATRATIVTLIPNGANFELVGGASAAWDKAKAYALVRYEGASGYAYVTGRATKVTGATYQCTTSEDWPADKSKMGLNVREGGKGTRVLRIIPAGDALEPRKPNEVAPGGTIAAGWHELAGGGWVYVRGGESPSVEHAYTVEPEAYDKVVGCKIPISADTVVGYPGPYLTRPATVHFEVFTGDAAFMKNPKGDTGGQEVLQIAAGKTFKSRKAPAADLKVDLTVGSQLRLLEDPRKNAQYRKVACDLIVGWASLSEVGKYNAKGSYYILQADLASLSAEPGGAGAALTINAKKGDKLVYYLKQGDVDRKVGFFLSDAERDKRTGFAERGALGDYDASKRRYELEKPLAALFKDDPESGSTFEADVGTNEEELFVEALSASDPAVARDKEGKLWQEVEIEPGKKGWIKREQDGVKVLCAFDWPRWKQVEEAEGYSADGLCDAAELVKLVDADGDGEVSAAELKKAIAEPGVAAKLRRVACVHPTEWAGEIAGSDRLMGPPWNLPKEIVDATRDYVKLLGFWADAKDAGLPPKDKVWHLHPIGAVEQLRALTSGKTLPPAPGNEAVTPKATHVKPDLTRPKPEQTKPLPEKASTRSCPQHKEDEVLTFIRGKMLANVKGPDMAYMRDNLAVTTWDLVVPLKQMIETIQAYWRWYSLVRNRGLWDYKREIKATYGEWCCDFASRAHYNQDIWSNLHYGYVGLACGFSRADLLDGAGIAQLRAGTMPDGYWKRRLDELGDADVFRALDDPLDQEAIKVGLELWEKHKDKVTQDQLKAALKAHAAKLNTGICDAQKASEASTGQPSSTGKSAPLPLEGSVGVGGDNHKKDVKAVRERLHALGFTWIDAEKETSDDTFVAAIRLFQTIIKGGQKISGDGLISKDAGTHRWLQARNAPRWQLMSASGIGFKNFERDDSNDTHDYCASWLDEVTIAAGKEYKKSYLATNTGASLIGINDGSLPHGGDTKDHAGHEAGLDIDVYLPTTGGTSGGITVSSDNYDRSAMRAMLKAFRAQALVSRVFLNDTTLIAEGLCAFATNHHHHAHVGIKAPTRQD